MRIIDLLGRLVVIQIYGTHSHSVQLATSVKDFNLCLY